MVYLLSAPGSTLTASEKGSTKKRPTTPNNELSHSHPQIRDYLLQTIYLPFNLKKGPGGNRNCLVITPPHPFLVSQKNSFTLHSIHLLADVELHIDYEEVKLVYQ